MITESIADMEKSAECAIGNGFQFCVHAIGDRGYRETLDNLDRAFWKDPVYAWLAYLARESADK